LKNNNSKLFIIGVIVGVTILFSAVNYQKFVALSDSSQGSTNTPSAANSLPHLIALEPTNVPVQPTQTVIPTPLIKPSSNPLATSSNPTATPLYLANEQEPETIGYSVNGLPLEVYTFGSGKHERMIVAGIHGGDEWNTVTLANQLIAYVNQYSNSIPEDVTLYILPNLNPDGEARAHNKYGRVNNNGVDLNRNFPVNWQADWARAGCWNYLPTSSGSEAGSEPETRALMSFIESHHIEALISYHSAALGVFPGGNPWDENSVSFAQAIARVSSYPFPPIDTGCKYSGTLADYAVSQGTTAVDLELTNHIDTDLPANLNILGILLTWQPQN
jgi:predicted deacylase